MAIAPASISAIASTIQQIEGYYPGSLAYRNNNPGNLVYTGQPGATRGAGGFAVFDSYQDGWNALQNQIQLYANRGLTIEQMMAIYAPASDPRNNPEVYAQSIAATLGVDPSTALADLGSGAAPTAVDYADMLAAPMTGLDFSNPWVLGGALLAGLGIALAVSEI